MHEVGNAQYAKKKLLLHSDFIRRSLVVEGNSVKVKASLGPSSVIVQCPIK